MNLKKFFSGKYHELHDHNRQTARQSGFHLENAVVDVLAVDILMAINHLALATTADRGIVAQLTTSNAKLTTVNAKIADTHNILGEQPRTALSIIKQLTEAVEAKP